MAVTAKPELLATVFTDYICPFCYVVWISIVVVLTRVVGRMFRLLLRCCEMSA